MERSRSPTRSMVCRIRIGVALEFDELIVLLARTAVGARPVGGNFFPFRTGGDAGIRVADGLVVDVAADQAHVSFHRERAIGVKSYFIKYAPPYAGGPSWRHELTTALEAYPRCQPPTIRIPLFRPSCWYLPHPIRRAAPGYRPTS